MNLFYQPLISDGVFSLDGEESRHCVKVLRRKSGDTIHITDGRGYFYDAIITNADARNCSFTVQNKSFVSPRDFSIHIGISPTKNTDRIEWFVEKCTEIGIEKITLLDCEHTERLFIKTERLEKVAVSAMKQSLKVRVPFIEPLTDFKKFIDEVTGQQKFIAFVDTTNPNHLMQVTKRSATYVVLIGPEGDFSRAELDAAIRNGFSKVSLGPERLRTETAGVAACHILNLINH